MLPLYLSNFTLSVVLPLLETSTRDTPPNESAAYERYAEDPNVENLKPPDPVIEDLGEVGGVPSAPSDAPGLPEGLERPGFVCVAAGMQGPRGALAITSVGLASTVANKAKGQESGGVPLVVNAAPAPAEDTASVDLVGAAEESYNRKTRGVGALGGG
jgi:hypothetical protein